MPLFAHPGMTHRPQQPMGQKGQAVMQYMNDVASGRIAEQGMRQYGDAVSAGMAGDYDAFGGLLGDAMGGGFAAQGLLGLPGMIGKTVWHGSPHKWDVPDISKVGTGEGAQAYGHGFYSAENPDVAKQYQENVKDMIAVTDINAELSRLSKIMSTDEFPGSYRKYRTNRGEEAAKQYDNLMSSREGVVNAPGNIYKLDIPDEDIPKYLDWDTPLSEQPELRSIYPGAYDELVNAHAKLPDEAKNHPQVKTLYNTGSLIKKLEEAAGPDAARQLLMQEGIPGIRYLDGTSRGAGGGTSNFVTFDPSRIKVLERN